MDTIGLGRACRICLDPGHGGRDSGCYQNGIAEKVPNLAIGLRLHDLLIGAGHAVFLTRGGDDYMELTNRGCYSVGANADLFVSVHHDDASPSTTRRGCSSFVRFEAYRNGMDLGSKITHALVETFDHGLAYGTWCQKHWVNLGVLRGCNNDGLVTATVVECACLSNAEDAALVRSAGYVERAALAIANGVHAHLGLPAVGVDPGPPIDGGPLRVVLGDEVIDCAPVIEGGTTRVALRPLVEALGYEPFPPPHDNGQNAIYLKPKTKTN